MAKSEELEALKAEVLEGLKKIKELEPDGFNKLADELISDVKGMKKKDDVSLNFEEDTVPVDAKDISVGLRNY